MVTNLVVKNGSNQIGRHNDLAFPLLSPSRNQSVYLSNIPADSGYHLQSSQHNAPTKAQGR